jgi:hypothetical protein
MNEGPPQRPDGRRLRRIRAVEAAWCAIAGVILSCVAAISLALGVVTVQQAIAICLPGGVLIVVGLTVATVPNAASGWRLGFYVGLKMGRLLSRLRALFRQNGY